MIKGLTTKGIILSAIKSKLEDSGITKLVFVFNVIDDRYNVMVNQQGQKPLKLDIEENEISLIKNLFIRKIVKKFSEKSKAEIKCVIIQINLECDEIDIFIQDIKDKVQLFDYK